MKKKVLISFLLIVMIIIALATIITKQEENPNKIEFVNYPTFTVMASSERNNLVDLNTTFNLSASEETTLELVQSSFSITPKVEYEITEIRKDYYELTLKEELKADTIYNIEYKTNEAPYKWSFQTEKKFNVATFYPNDTGYVMPSTVIEMDFTYMPNKGIEEYFSISPEVNGKFEYDGRRIRFLPNNKLTLATTYTVTIKEGFGNEENDELTKEQTFRFSTTVSERLGNMYGLDTIYFTDNKYAFGENQNIYITFEEYFDATPQNYKLAIYQYKDSSDYANDIKQKEAYGNYPELKPVDLNKLNRISEKNIPSSEVLEIGWRKALPINETLAEGYYMLVITVNNLEYYLPLQINNMIAVTEYFDDTFIAWVHDLKTGEPLSNVNIKIDDTVIGITNEDGYCFAEGIKLPEEKELLLQIFAEGKTTIYDVLNIYSYSWYESESEYNNSYIRFDRGTFKAGETLNVWGFVKDRKNHNYKECTLRVQSWSSGAVFEEKTVELDEFGTFKTSFDLTNYASDSYDVMLYVNGHQTFGKSFEIKDYETRSYDVSMQLDKEYVRDGEKITCYLTAKLFDGTPIENLAFTVDIDINYQDTVKTEVITDENGNATIEIDTNISYLYNNPVYGYIEIKPKGIEDQSSLFDSFVIYPHEETFEIKAEYDKKNNQYNFEIETYKNDFTDMKNVKKGEMTNRSGALMISKYRKNRVVTSTYYDENTKTMKENYKIVKVLEGNETIKYNTVNGKATVTYPSPYASIDEGIIEFGSYITSELDGKDILYRWPSISGYSEYEEANKELMMENYHLKYDENYDDYKVGEDILLKIITNDDKELTKAPYVLYIVKSAAGTEVITTKSDEYRLKFQKEYGADVTVEGFIFDGICIRKLGSYYYETERTYSLSNDELKIDVSVEMDKTQYKPGETAKIKVITKIDGVPVKAAVNLSAVNKEYLAENGIYSNIMAALHNYYNFYIKAQSYTHTIISNSFEGGGGGGDGSVRTNFATTAFFETIYTDENGVATYEVKLPDNITTWNLNVQATTKDYKAAQLDEDIVVTLPFFATAVMNEKYLVGETPSISIRTNGTEVNIGDDVSYEIKITDQNNKEVILNENSKVGHYARVSLGKLEEGTYKIFVRATSGNLTDAFEKEIEAVKTFQETMHTVRYDLVKGNEIGVDKGSGIIYLYNSDIEKIFDDLYILANLPKVRNDQKVISYLAENILRKLQNIDKPVEMPYINYYNGVALIADVSYPDALLTAKIASTGIITKSPDCVNYFRKIVDDRNNDIREKLYSYWGLAALKEPVLNELVEIETKLTPEERYEKAIVALAYADIGDYTRAEKIFEELYALAENDNDEVYEYITMLAFKLNRRERDELYERYVLLNRETEFSNFVKLFRVQNEIQNNVKDAFAVFEINGEEKKIDIVGTRIETLSFTFKDDITIKDKSENVIARFKKTEEIREDKIVTINAIEKTYTVNGNRTNHFKVGDTVTVTLKLDYDKLEKENNPQLYMVEEVLPNCMKYSENEDYSYSHVRVKTPIKKDGQKLYFYVHKCNEGEQYVSYRAIVTAEGEFKSDGIILKDVENNIIDYYRPENVIVK